MTEEEKKPEEKQETTEEKKEPETKPEEKKEETKTETTEPPKTEPPKEDDTKKSLDEIKSMMENLLKDIKAKPTEPAKTEGVKTEKPEEKKDTEPTGEKVELNFGKNRYIIQIPSEWDEVMVAKLKVLIDEAEKTGRTLILDKALNILEAEKIKVEEKKE